jgi:hypothetical protein
VLVRGGRQLAAGAAALLPLPEAPPEDSPEDDFFGEVPFEELPFEELPDDDPPDDDPLESDVLFEEEPASLLPAPSEDVEAPRESVR